MSDLIGNLDDWRIPTGTGSVRLTDESLQRRQQREKKQNLLFARIPYVLGMKAAGIATEPVWATLLALWHLRFTRHKNPVELPNTYLKECGISRHSKLRALQKLEAVGLIRVEYRERKSPLITLLWSE
jgi:hypothetical protein